MRVGTKTHQQRRKTLDDETVEVLRAYIERVDTQARQLRVKLPLTAFLFTSASDGSEPLVPDTATQRYGWRLKHAPCLLDYLAVWGL